MHLANINISTQAVSDIMCAERKIPKPVTSLYLLQKLDFFGKVSPLFRDPVSIHFTVLLQILDRIAQIIN